MPDFRQLTLRERLERFPPFLCVALSRVKTAPLTQAEKQSKYWNRKARAKRRRLRQRGIELPKKPLWRRLDLDEIAAFGHLNPKLVTRLSSMKDWNQIGVFTMLRFLEVCGVDLMRIAKETRFIRYGLATNKAFQHLTKPQMARFAKMVREWRK